MGNSTNLKRKVMCLLALCFNVLVVSAAGTKEVYTFDVVRPVGADKEVLTSCGLNSKYTALKMGCLSADELNNKLAKGDVKFIARQGTTASWYGTASFGSFGHTFSTKGIALASNTHRNAALMSKYENGDFYIGHIPEKVVEGETYTFTQAFGSGH